MAARRLWLGVVAGVAALACSAPALAAVQATSHGVLVPVAADGGARARLGADRSARPRRSRRAGVRGAVPDVDDGADEAGRRPQGAANRRGPDVRRPAPFCRRCELRRRQPRSGRRADRRRRGRRRPARERRDERLDDGRHAAEDAEPPVADRIDRHARRPAHPVRRRERALARRGDGHLAGALRREGRRVADERPDRHVVVLRLGLAARERVPRPAAARLLEPGRLVQCERLRRLRVAVRTGVRRHAALGAQQGAAARGADGAIHVLAPDGDAVVGRAGPVLERQQRGVCAWPCRATSSAS